MLLAHPDITVSGQRKVPKLISSNGRWAERVNGLESYQNNTVHHHLSKRQTQSSKNTIQHMLYHIIKCSMISLFIFDTMDFDYDGFGSVHGHCMYTE